MGRPCRDRPVFNEDMGNVSSCQKGDPQATIRAPGGGSAADFAANRTETSGSDFARARGPNHFVDKRRDGA